MTVTDYQSRSVASEQLGQAVNIQRLAVQREASRSTIVFAVKDIDEVALSCNKLWSTLCIQIVFWVLTDLYSVCQHSTSHINYDSSMQPEKSTKLYSLVLVYLRCHSDYYALAPSGLVWRREMIHLFYINLVFCFVADRLLGSDERSGTA